jgi:hypothetical protein
VIKEVLCKQSEQARAPLCTHSVPQESYSLEQSPSQHPLAWGLSCQVVSALRSLNFIGIFFVVSIFFVYFCSGMIKAY